jgi:subtilisin family serine protease
MPVKPLHSLLLAFILLTLIVGPIQVRGAEEVVGVRIQSTMLSGGTRASLEGKVIDYGSFTWVVMEASQLADLGRAGVTYQSVKNPYILTLGGSSFDPLIAFPEPAINFERSTSDLDTGLFLVQFYGPIKSEWLDALEKAGLKVLQYIHPFTYVVWGKASSIDGQTRQELVRWVGAYQPEFALNSGDLKNSGAEILVRLMIVRQADFNHTLDAIQSLGGVLNDTDTALDPNFNLATFSLPEDQLQSVASLPGVYAISPIPTDGGDRGEMSNQVNVGNYATDNTAFPGYLTWLDSLGLSGEGVIIANVDSGLDQDHPDLVNRMLPCTGSTCGGDVQSDHGTHTAGIMAGDGSSGVVDPRGFLRGLGMAPGASLIEQVYDPTYLDPGGLMTLMSQSSQNQAVISGNSWGPSGTPLGYDQDTRLVDIGVRDANPDLAGNQALSYVLSFMNGNGGTSSQGTPDEAKNIFTVGSTRLQNSNGSQNLNIDDISSNSAHGPALDGRNIPHLVAPGCYVDSTLPNASYSTKCGTSMASPHVTGAVALFYERYRGMTGLDPSPALVKAAFLPVAHDLAGHLDADGGLLGHPFDSKQGWGRLNADSVLNPSGEVIYLDQQVIFDDTGESFSFSIDLIEPYNQVRAMLVWTDAPGHGLGGSTPAWVNDLDLSVFMDGLTYYGNQFGEDGFSIPGGAADDKNNSEGIFLQAVPSGTFEITVTAANISGDGVPNVGDQTDQDFALVLYISPGQAPFQAFVPLVLH